MQDTETQSSAPAAEKSLRMPETARKGKKMNVNDYFKKSVLESFTASQGLTADFIRTLIISMIFAIILGVLVYVVYSRYYGGVVYSNSFAVTLIGMAILTCMLTLAISSNVVVSLGMVGALSIVRFRTAIKDPMDLLYLFWAISIGITCGAGLYILAMVTMVIMVVVIHIAFNKRKKGLIYVMVVHYETGMAGDEILRAIGKIRHQLKSKTTRGDTTEMTIELMCRNSNTVFMETIQGIEGVRDVTLIQYNGEYHG